MRINVNPMDQNFLLEQQSVRFQANAPYGFQDMAVSNGSYLALTAPTQRNSVTQLSGSKQSGNIYILDLGKIERDGAVPSSALVALEAGNFPVTGRGSVPQYISAGLNEGEFLLSSAKDHSAGLIGFRAKLDGKGNLTGEVATTTPALTPRNSDSAWVQRKFQQNIQRAADTVIVEYRGTQYALVADYNFLFNDVHFNPDSNFGFGKQIGGKIGVIEDPFGEHGAPKFLGATTPIVGGAVEHLTLGADAKLYADVFLEDVISGTSRMHKSLFVWNANALIELALRAESGGQKTSTPIDRPNGQAIQINPPLRYDGATENNEFGWTYGIGAYAPPGRFPVLGAVDLVGYPPLTTQPESSSPTVEDTVFTRLLGITDQQVEADIQAGKTDALSAAKYFGKVVLYNGWNFFTAGFVGRQGERVQAVEDGQLSDSHYLTASLSDAVTSVASIALSARAGSAVSNVASGVWGGIASGAAGEVTFAITQKAGEIGTYYATDGQAGSPGITPALLNSTIQEIAVGTAIESGLGFVGGVLGRLPRVNYKVMWNSPTTTNPLPFKLVATTPSGKTNGLQGTLADSTGGGAHLTHSGGVLTSPSGVQIQLPPKGSISTQEAVQWLEAQGVLIPQMINKNASLREQAWQAVEIKNALTTASRNAMQNSSAAAQLSLTRPAFSYGEMLKRNNAEYAGDALYQRIIDASVADTAALQSVSSTIGCFVGGTLVHTKEGLVPIEQIKVGDWVLSQPEQQGELTYKRVLRTFEFDDKVIILLSFYIVDPNLPEGGRVETIAVTPNHPFWVPEQGWTRADNLPQSTKLRLQDGSNATVLSLCDLYRTDQPDVAWGRGIAGSKANDYSGDDVYFREDFLENGLGYGLPGYYSYNNKYWRLGEEGYFKRRVYNLEVEDTHTYYVGELGVWVHNTNCGDLGVSFVEAGVGLKPSPKLRVYDDRVLELVTLPGSDRGVILVREVSGGAAGASPATQAFETATQGALKDKSGIPTPWSLRFDNDIPSSTKRFNYIRLGDGRAVLADGSITNTFIDAKAGEIWRNIDGFMSQERTQALNSFQRLAKALTDNGPDYSHIVEFEDSVGLQAYLTFFERDVASQAWFTKDVSEKIMFRVRGQDSGAYANGYTRGMEPLTIFPKAADGTVTRIDGWDHQYIKATDANNPLDVANEFLSIDDALHQDVAASGSALAVAELTLADLLSVLPVAKQYWLDAGASASAVDNARIGIGTLATGAAALTQGLQVTLSIDGAGWGWFVDPTPLTNEEFESSSTALGLDAPAGSLAADKLDLLTVLIHELGHVLGVENRQADDVMTRVLDPGERRLPNDVDAFYLNVLAPTTGPAPTANSSTTLSVSQSWVPPTVNSVLRNGDFGIDGTDSWVAEGDITVNGQAVTLSESATSQTHLAQSFMVNSGDKVLSFTVEQADLHNNARGPADAFEVALLDANTGEAIASITELDGSDALLNVQIDTTAQRIERQ
ncbi:MAG: polymorphic toxin-type HINT domain-containing protein, partial [Burkholderiaceae bacterium]|nr:polymorphic toxin-type HINT domain-containing protein [Burkholderiaceae bacterium]